MTWLAVTVQPAFLARADQAEVSPILYAALGTSDLTSSVVTLGSITCSAMCSHITLIAALPFTIADSGGRAVASSVQSDATLTKSLLAFAQPLLNEVRNALIVRRDPGHDGLSFDHLHVVGNAAYFLGAKPPKFWIVNFVRGHKQLIRPRSASVSDPLMSSLPLP